MIWMLVMTITVISGTVSWRTGTLLQCGTSGTTGEFILLGTMDLHLLHLKLLCLIRTGSPLLHQCFQEPCHNTVQASMAIMEPMIPLVQHFTTQPDRLHHSYLHLKPQTILVLVQLLVLIPTARFRRTYRCWRLHQRLGEDEETSDQVEVSVTGEAEILVRLQDFQVLLTVDSRGLLLQGEVVGGSKVTGLVIVMVRTVTDEGEQEEGVGGRSEVALTKTLMLAVEVVVDLVEDGTDPGDLGAT